MSATLNELGERLKTLKKVFVEKSLGNCRVNQMSDFNRFSDDIKKDLIGIESGDWEAFKRKLIEQDAKLGIKWVRGRGRNGPIQMVSIRFLKSQGVNLASGLLDDENYSDGDFRVLLEEEVPGLKAFMSDNGEYVDLELSQARDGFTSRKKGGRKFTFKPGVGHGYRCALETVKFVNANGRKDERGLGTQLVSKGLLKDVIRAEKVLDLQGLNDLGKLKNVDLAGYSINSFTEKEEMSVIAVELKADNSLPSIMTAMAQALSYKEFANYVYIAAPSLSSLDFHDGQRFEEIYRACQVSGLGILSLGLNVDNTEAVSANVVLVPEKSKIYTAALIEKIVEGTGLELCPVCHRYVDPETRERCGWSVDGECMKTLMEKSVSIAPVKLDPVK